MLKALILATSAQGTLDDFQSRQAARSKDIKKRSLGELAKMLHTGLYKEKEPSELPENVTAPSFSVSFKIEMDPAVAKERKRNLSVLVSERNRLIHSDLATFDPDSVESCATLSAFLDEQNDRILKQLDSLKFLSDAVSELGKALGEFSESEEFLEMIRREVDGA